METMKLEDIIVPPERQRSAPDPQKFEDLKRSIREEGLLHAVILDENHNLVAGLTRLRAVAELYTEEKGIIYNHKAVKMGHIPFTTTHKTDELSLFKIELEENLRREQLGPVDEAAALARLHELRQKNAPEIIAGFQTQVTYKDTAKESLALKGNSNPTPAQINSEQTHVSESIMIEAYKDHPEVKKAKSFGEAARAARKVAEREFRTLLGNTQVSVEGDTRHQVLRGDCAEILPTLTNGSVDCILVDPPYGVGADKFGEKSWGHGYEDSADQFELAFKILSEHASRLCKPDAALFMFLDVAAFYPTAKAMRESWSSEGWYIWPTPLFWHKTNRGHAPQPKRGPNRAYETILYALRGNREVRKTGSDILAFAAPDVKEHGAQKPQPLLWELLSWIVYPGDTVLDPYAGSGSIIPVAHSLDCKVITIEKDPGSYSLCQEKLQGTLT